MSTKVLFEASKESTESKVIFLRTETQIVRVLDINDSFRSEIGVVEDDKGTYVMYHREDVEAITQGSVKAEENRGLLTIKDGGSVTMTPLPEFSRSTFNGVYDRLIISREQEA